MSTPSTTSSSSNSNSNSTSSSSTSSPSSSSSSSSSSSASPPSPSASSSDPSSSTELSSAEIDEEFEELKRKLAEEEAKASQSGDKSSSSSSSSSSSASSSDIDSRSVFVGQVDYSATVEDLKTLFSACGPVNRVTILVDKHTGHPRGFAYIEFKDQESVNNAVLLNDTEFKGRQLKVTPKRTNVPSFQLRGGRGGKGMNSRGRHGHMPMPQYGYAYGYAPLPPPIPSYRGGRGGYNPALARGGYAPRGGVHKNQKAVYSPY